MRRAIWVTTTALVVAVLLLLAGCGGTGTTDESEDGKSSGTTVEQGDVTEGVPIYPGATEVDMSGLRRGGPADGTPPGVEDGQNPDSMPTGDGEELTRRPTPPEGQEPPEGAEDGSPPEGMRAMPVAYRTADSVDKVTAWYKERLSGMTDFDETTMPSWGGTDEEETGEGAAFTFKVGDTQKMVMIRTDGSDDGGGTLIMISNAGGGMPQSPPAYQE